MYTPRSLADSTAIRVFPINETVKLTECLLIICLVPINMNFVFSGFINKSFVQQQVATLRKSSSSLNLASIASIAKLESHRRMTRAGRNEEHLADRWDKYRRGAAKESLPGGLRVWLVMDLIAQNRYALIGSSLKGSCGTTELKSLRWTGELCLFPYRSRNVSLWRSCLSAKSSSPSTISHWNFDQRYADF